jgi:hypothetical protein
MLHILSVLSWKKWLPNKIIQFDFSVLLCYDFQNFFRKYSQQERMFIVRLSE